MAKSLLALLLLLFVALNTAERKRIVRYSPAGDSLNVKPRPKSYDEAWTLLNKETEKEQKEADKKAKKEGKKAKKIKWNLPQFKTNNDVWQMANVLTMLAYAKGVKSKPYGVFVNVDKADYDALRRFGRAGESVDDKGPLKFPILKGAEQSTTRDKCLFVNYKANGEKKATWKFAWFEGKGIIKETPGKIASILGKIKTKTQKNTPSSGSDASDVSKLIPDINIFVLRETVFYDSEDPKKNGSTYKPKGSGGDKGAKKVDKKVGQAHLTYYDNLGEFEGDEYYQDDYDEYYDDYYQGYSMKDRLNRLLRAYKELN